MNKRYSYDLNCLRNFLISNSNQNIIILNIEEIEKIIKGKLPDFAYNKSTFNRFWYNDINNNPSYSPYWLNAGFYAYCDMNNGTVTFSKEQRVRRKTLINKARNQVAYEKLEIENAINLIKKYHYSENENYTRYKSWEHCYNAFRIYRKDKLKTEFLCLHLGCYLASWGMLRNSVLINYDYLVHKKFVEAISNDKYDALYSENYKNEELVFDVVKLINDTYPANISKTDTLVTKVLLGVFGCTPAFDRYFRDGVKHFGICSADFGRQSLRALYSFYDLYYKELENLRHSFLKEGTYYTPMKLLDMCFWQFGYDNDKSKNLMD